MVGQQHFQKPTHEQVAAFLNGENPDLWIGLIDEPNSRDAIMDYVEAHPYLFAQPEDGDLYAWIRELGIYAPVIHLQQTDGNSSKHLPFTEANNAKGIVHGKEVLQAFAESYANAQQIEGLAPVEELYFTIEVFSGTSQRYPQIIEMIRESAEYWRQFIPEDGITLDEALARL